MESQCLPGAVGTEPIKEEGGSCSYQQAGLKKEKAEVKEAERLGVLRREK